jgi:hypothetical protein
MMMTGEGPMPAERVSMRRVREILRLKHECGATERAIAQSLGIARSTVAITLDRLAATELGWPLPATLSDRVLEAMLYAGPGTKSAKRPAAWTVRARTLRDGRHRHGPALRGTAGEPSRKSRPVISTSPSSVNCFALDDALEPGPL